MFWSQWVSCLRKGPVYWNSTKSFQRHWESGQWCKPSSRYSTCPKETLSGQTKNATDLRNLGMSKEELIKAGHGWRWGGRKLLPIMQSIMQKLLRMCYTHPWRRSLKSIQNHWRVTGIAFLYSSLKVSSSSSNSTVSWENMSAVWGIDAQRQWGYSQGSFWDGVKSYVADTGFGPSSQRAS